MDLYHNLLYDLIFSSIIILLACVHVSSATVKVPKFYDSLDFASVRYYTFDDFVNVYHKDYVNNEVEMNKRRPIYESHLQKIRAHNERFKRNEVQWYQRVYDFHDMDEQEFAASHLGVIIDEHNDNESTLPPDNLSTAPSSSNSPPLATGSSPDKMRAHHINSLYTKDDLIDWRERGAVTYVKNQNACGNCYEFSAIETLESRFYLKYGGYKNDSNSPYRRTSLVYPMSIQQYLDCQHRYGCSGGNSQTVLEFMIDNAVESDNVYPYYAEAQSVCQQNKSLYGIGHSGNSIYGRNNVEDLVEQVLLHGPLTVYIAMPGSYGGGIISNQDDCAPHITHAVVVAGIGRSENKLYYIVRNSWGVNWGHNGYFYVEVGSNICQIEDTYIYTTDTTLMNGRTIANFLDKLQYNKPPLALEVSAAVNGDHDKKSHNYYQFVFDNTNGLHDENNIEIVYHENHLCTSEAKCNNALKNFVQKVHQVDNALHGNTTQYNLLLSMNFVTQSATLDIPALVSTSKLNATTNASIKSLINLQSSIYADTIVRSADSSNSQIIYEQYMIRSGQSFIFSLGGIPLTNDDFVSCILWKFQAPKSLTCKNTLPISNNEDVVITLQHMQQHKTIDICPQNALWPARILLPQIIANEYNQDYRININVKSSYSVDVLYNNRLLVLKKDDLGTFYLEPPIDPVTTTTIAPSSSTTTTPVPSTTTPVPMTTTPVQSTTTPVPSTTTPVQSTTTPVPSTTTPVPLTTTPVQSTTTQVPSTTSKIIVSNAWTVTKVVPYNEFKQPTGQCFQASTWQFLWYGNVLHAFDTAIKSYNSCVYMVNLYDPGQIFYLPRLGEIDGLLPNSVVTFYLINSANIYTEVELVTDDGEPLPNNDMEQIAPLTTYEFTYVSK